MLTTWFSGTLRTESSQYIGCLPHRSPTGTGPSIEQCWFSPSATVAVGGMASIVDAWLDPTGQFAPEGFPTTILAAVFLA